MLAANSSITSRNSLSSTNALITSRTSYGTVGSFGTIDVMSYCGSGAAGAIFSALVVLFIGIIEISLRIWTKHSSSLVAKK